MVNFSVALYFHAEIIWMECHNQDFINPVIMKASSIIKRMLDYAILYCYILYLSAHWRAHKPVWLLGAYTNTTSWCQYNSCLRLTVLFLYRNEKVGSEETWVFSEPWVAIPVWRGGWLTLRPTCFLCLCRIKMQHSLRKCWNVLFLWYPDFLVRPVFGYGWHCLCWELVLR